MISAMSEVKAASVSTAMNVLIWALRVIAAVILLQTLFFKFTGAPESIYIFSKVADFTGIPAEPYGRIGSGVIELIASILLVIPRTTWLGALISVGVMAGAIATHLLILGIEVQGDKGLLFFLGLTVLLCSGALLVIFRGQIPVIGKRLV